VRSERNSATLDEVDHATGCGHHEVDPLLELCYLAFDIGPAVDGGHAPSNSFSERREFLGHLHCQFAGWHESDRRWFLRLRAFDHLENW